MPAISTRTRLLLVIKMLLLMLLRERRERREQQRRQQRRRRILEQRQQLLRQQGRQQQQRRGPYQTAVHHRQQGDKSFFLNYYRLLPQNFDTLLSIVAADLTRVQLFEPLVPAERLALTLSYLGSGKEMEQVALAYRVSFQTAQRCILHTCRVIWARLKDRFMPTPTKDHWKKIASGFSTRWQFPNCLGVVEGKHVAIVRPQQSENKYINYKGTHSIVLMGVVDSSCKYVLVDVGAEGRLGEGGTLKDCKFGKALVNGDLDIPSPGPLPGTTRTVPYVFIGDESFQLRKDVMRPFPARQREDERRVFNYRLNRAKRCAENAFNLTVLRWQILLRKINLPPADVDYIVKVACVLHNFVMDLEPLSNEYPDREDDFGNVKEGPWRPHMRNGIPWDREKHFFPLEATLSRNHTSEAAHTRNLITAHFCGEEGEVPWQWSQSGVSKEGALKRLREEPCYQLQ